MVEQIGTAIIMFLLGSVLTYFSTRWSRTLHKIESLEHGVQALLRDRMLQMYSYYKEKHPLKRCLVLTKKWKETVSFLMLGRNS